MRKIPITDLDLPELALYRERAETRLMHCNEPEPGVFIAESPKVIGRALDAGFVPLSAVVDEAQLEERETAEVLPRLGEIPVYTASSKVLKELVGYQMVRGLLCMFARGPLKSREEAAAGASRIVLLERVTNPTNVGAIIRSAAALWVDAVILSADCADPYYRRAARVSMGNVFALPWAYLPERLSCAEYLRELKEQGFVSVAMALDERAVRLGEKDFGREEKLVIVMGSEGEGLRPETIEACDATVMIPMSREVDSLNVAAASAVAMWELRKRP